MTTGPRRMTVQVAGTEAPLLDTLVVTLGDGRLGFSGVIGHVADLDGATIELTGDQTVWGVARLVRSGTAYEEVRGRTRQADGWSARWRSRRDDAVVLIDPG
jgi:hypothetical protein